MHLISKVRALRGVQNQQNRENSTKMCRLTFNHLSHIIPECTEVEVKTGRPRVASEGVRVHVDVCRIEQRS